MKKSKNKINVGQGFELDYWLICHKGFGKKKNQYFTFQFVILSYVNSKWCGQFPTLAA